MIRVAEVGLLDLVPREFLPELGINHLVLGLVERGNGGVEGGAVHEVLLAEVLLSGHFIGGVGLGAGAEAHAGDAVAALETACSRIGAD
jgi:hypothetical protein